MDPTCSLHGIPWSQHPEGRCLYCCLCFKTLTYETCHLLPDGTREDVCDECAEKEAMHDGYLDDLQGTAGEREEYKGC